jgi:hypothetical protein
MLQDRSTQRAERKGCVSPQSLVYGYGRHEFPQYVCTALCPLPKQSMAQTSSLKTAGIALLLGFKCSCRKPEISLEPRID